MITLPSDEILFSYASGTLDPALRLLVERHLALHPQTQQRLASFTDFGGLMLAAEAPAAMTAGSLDRALARIAANPPPLEPVRSDWPDPATLKWRWAGPGRAIAPFTVAGSAYRSYALRIAPGKAMLQHSHSGQEWTLVLQGSFRDEAGEHAAGAFLEEDEATTHTPVATGDRDCLCLSVLAGTLTAPGIMGRIARHIMR